MLQRGEGRIVNIASIAGIGGYGEAAAYMASKGGVVQLTKALAIDWSMPRRIPRAGPDSYFPQMPPIGVPVRE